MRSSVVGPFGPVGLGGLSPATFLRRHWRKRPLLIRQALPGFAGILDRDALFQLALRADATSRLVIDHAGGRVARDGGGRGGRRRPGRWERHDGPFGGLDASMLPASHWTLLVHGIESLIPGGWELLRAFSFIPAARIDDLMVSYAADGGSVGPHDDRYDVFLLQGPGRRRWQVSTRGDHQVDPRAAIKVLRSFVAEEEWLLEPGDMLYLPPGVAHWGIAEGPSFTYSVGFLAPSHEELIQSFLGYLGHALAPAIDADALVQDADLRLQDEPLALDDAMVKKVASILGAVRWDPATVEDFLGSFLTRPKPRISFAPPPRPLSAPAFARRLRRRGRLSLALPSRGLVRRRRLYFNGEAHVVRPTTLRLFQQLVGERALDLPLPTSAEARALLYAWYLAGYLTVV